MDDQTLTPSGWHDAARRRDAGHDAMQHLVWRVLQDGVGDVTDGYVLRDVVAEFPIYVSGGPKRILAFADIARIWYHENGNCRLDLFEIKPRIDTIGGILRQCETLQAMTRGTPRVTQIICVWKSDPKLAMLQDLAQGRFLIMALSKPEVLS